VAAVQYTFTQKQYMEQHNQLIWEECGPCLAFARYTLAFALHLKKKYGKTSVRVYGLPDRYLREIETFWRHDVLIIKLPLTL
jgi:hypothetical protein